MMKFRVKINGEPVEGGPREIAAEILSLYRDLPYWSPDGLERYYVGVMTMVEEIIRDDRGATPAAFRRYARRRLDLFRRRKQSLHDGEGQLAILKWIYEEVLSAEGMPLLKGFGWKGKADDARPRGNPEKQSLVSAPTTTRTN